MTGDRWQSANGVVLVALVLSGLALSGCAGMGGYQPALPSPFAAQFHPQPVAGEATRPATGGAAPTGPASGFEVRGQNAPLPPNIQAAPPTLRDDWSTPMVASGQVSPPSNGLAPPPNTAPSPVQGFTTPNAIVPPPPPPNTLPPPPGAVGPYYGNTSPPPGPTAPLPDGGQTVPLFEGGSLMDAMNEPTPADVDVFVSETQTGRFMFGVGVNSDAGLTGQIVIDERNFDWRRVPTSFQDFVNGTAFRGRGQSFRLEAMPGTVVQRYMVSFTEPYLFDTPISMNLSGYFFDRNYFDWDEQRLGGRVGFGYRLTHDLSLGATVRLEQVDITNPRVLGVAELDDVLGESDLFSGRVTLTHDTRDVPFVPTEGHLIELSYEQAFGDFDYPRGDIDLRKYYLIRERPDGSGRHTLTAAVRVGFSGSQTPIYENYFAGGYSTLRGFDFRGASPVVGGVTVGGEFRFLGTLEYMFPLTADDMLKGVVFCDFGTVEEQIEMHAEDFRVAPGFGLRINLPAFGPAPLALDLAFPVAHEDTDDIQNFTFSLGFNR